MIQVFVYGTLKRGERNFHHLRDARFVGEHLTRPRYTMYSFDSYPAVCQNGRQAIEGEIFRVSARRLLALDRLEGHPEYYRRIRIETEYGQAWMYVMQRERCLGRKQIGGSW